MSRHGLFKALFSFALLTLGQQASAQIIIGPPASQEIPIFGAPLLLVLGGFMMFLAYKFGLAKQARRSSLALLAGLLGIASIGSALYPLTEAHAGTASSPNIINITTNAQNGHAILISGGSNNGFNRYNNNSGITLEVKSITLPGTCNNSATANQCSVGLSIANGDFCAIDCN
ncbi:midcut-by-XrtH protein [Pseudoteredinibacter isoporae]|nr:midcut-by-XrtH protein [Pseudoteredinibacter isoporae]NHO85516.1 midcut-by-XrtH protein [Pseudoteredinibacter isoporae]NIB26032.1 midcut-by-XrtH protein [Pseudoteredinibacter isoporae]